MIAKHQDPTQRRRQRRRRIITNTIYAVAAGTFVGAIATVIVSLAFGGAR